jgi:hypothetical protein
VQGDHPPAGYYPDPDDSRLQRWWDGSSWAVPATGTRRSTPPSITTTPPPATNQYAILSLALSIAWIFFVGSVLGVIFGHLAMAQIRESGGQEIGRGNAMIGLIVGYVGIACGLLVALIVAAG